MSATPSEESMQLASAYIQHTGTCDEQYQTTLKCVCAFVREKNDLASQIDALVARRVEEEREMCANVCDEAARNRRNQHEDEFMQKTTVFAQRSGSHPTTVRYAASLLAAAIRTTPTN